jgi:uncharacterized protein (DUF305 family)
MYMDKKTMLMAGGAFILGGLTVGCMMHMHERYGGDSRFEHGMMGNWGTEREATNRLNNIETNQTGGMMNQNTHGMMGSSDSNMGMGGMHNMDMMVQSEREFLQEMIPHHEEAVATAKEVVARGGSTPEIKTLAQNIIAAQEKEITDMKTWFKNWYGVDYTADEKYQPMMRPLTDLSGAALDKVFLTDMIQHHMGAIMMANSVTPHIEHTEMTTLVGNIKTTQSAEITQMQNLLKTLQ